MAPKTDLYTTIHKTRRYALFAMAIGAGRLWGRMRPHTPDEVGNLPARMLSAYGPDELAGAPQTLDAGCPSPGRPGRGPDGPAGTGGAKVAQQVPR